MITISELVNLYPSWVKYCGMVLIVCIFIYIIILIAKYPETTKKPTDKSLQQSSIQPNETQKEQITWVDSDPTLKHKIIYRDQLDFKVEDIPWCIKHDMKLIDYGEFYVCTKLNCNTMMAKKFKDKIHETAKSLAENKLRHMI